MIILLAGVIIGLIFHWTHLYKIFENFKLLYTPNVDKCSPQYKTIQIKLIINIAWGLSLLIVGCIIMYFMIYPIERQTYKNYSSQFVGDVRIVTIRICHNLAFVKDECYVHKIEKTPFVYGKPEITIVNEE